MSERVNVRLTIGEAKELDEYCERHDTSRAEGAREGIKKVLAEEEK